MPGNGPGTKQNDKGKGKASVTAPPTNTPAANTPNPPPTTTRTRRSTTQPADTPITDPADDLGEEIRDATTGRDYLLSYSFLVQGAECTIGTLADTLLRITTLNMPRTTRNAIRAVVMLMKKADLEVVSLALAHAINNRLEELHEPPICSHQDQAAAIPQADINKITANITCSITNHLTEELASIRKQITDSTTTISDSASKISNNATTYREALLREGPTATGPPRTVADPKIQARKAAQAKQLLVDFTEQDDRLKFRNTSLTGIVESANAALKETGFTGPGHFIGAAKMSNGGILLESNDPTVVAKISEEATGQLFLDNIAPSAIMRKRTYNVILLFVPLTFRTSDEQDTRDLEESNGLEPRSIAGVRWIKPPDRRSPTQVFGHAIASFKDPHQANKAIANGIVICQKRVNAVKDRKEPVRCMKCQKWGHMAIACIATNDTCGQCGGTHRTSQCDGSTTFCTPCGSPSHPSWHRSCPTFRAKREELDNRTPDNLLAYFPTDEPWTQTTRRPPRSPDNSWTQGPTRERAPNGHHPHPAFAGRGRGRGRPPNHHFSTTDYRPAQTQSRAQDPPIQTPIAFPSWSQPATQSSQPPTLTTARRAERSLPPRGRQVNAIASSSREDGEHRRRVSSNPLHGGLRQTTLPFRPSQRPTDAVIRNSGDDSPTPPPPPFSSEDPPIDAPDPTTVQTTQPRDSPLHD